MKRILAAILALLIVSACAVAYAAGSGHVTSEIPRGKVRQIIWAYTADASGDASQPDLPRQSIQTGVVFAFTHIPDDAADGTDIVISASRTIDIEGAGTRTVTITDILGGQGADLATADSGEKVSLNQPYPLVGWKLSMSVSNAGDAGSGTFILWVWED
jgi:hypothetical protein